MTLRPPRHQVDRRAVRWWTLQAVTLVGWVPLALGILILLIPPARLWLTVGLVAVVVPSLVYLLVMPRWRYRIHRWEVTDDAVYAASGWIWQQWRVAPMSRIQTVDTVRGPLQQLFSLSSVTVTTASSAGPITIGGLDHEVATGLVERLTARTQATPGDAT